MSDVLLLEQRCRNTIILSESHFREFKSALDGPPGKKKPRRCTDICRDIGEALVAFANADGGELLIGVEDDGAITGVPHGDDEVAAMLAAPKTHVYPGQDLPITLAASLLLDGHTVLFFQVQKGSTHVYQLPDGRCVRRKDKATMPVAFQEIVFERQEVRSREFDRQFVDGAGVTDLDLKLVQAVAASYLPGLSPELYLQQAMLAEYGLGGLRLRRAALLLFAADVRLWHPRCQVRILRVAGTQLHAGEAYNVRSDETVYGNIVGLLTDSWERLRAHLVERTEFTGDAKFQKRYLYPERACREALVNAIAHRDYTIQNGIEVYLFDDRMEVRSPGPLLSTVSIEGLKALEGEHESRNELIARVLQENQFMRELGEGMKRIFDAVQESEQQSPILTSNGSSFTITLRQPSIFDEQQLEWLDRFAQSGLSKLQRRVVVLGMHGRELSQNDIFKALRTDDRLIYQQELSPLRKKGVLVEVVSQSQAQRIAKARGLAKADVPRFKVMAPQAPTTRRR